MQGFTGVSHRAFKKLRNSFGQADEEEVATREEKRAAPRQRQAGGGRKAVVEMLDEKRVFILLYFKYDAVQGVQGYFFGLGQSQAKAWIHRLRSVLNQA